MFRVSGWYFIVFCIYSQPFIIQPLYHLSTRRKQIIPDDKAENNNDDGEKPICNKKHNRHADAKPEQNKSEESFHLLSPARTTRFLLRSQPLPSYMRSFRFAMNRNL